MDAPPRLIRYREMLDQFGDCDKAYGRGLGRGERPDMRIGMLLQRREDVRTCRLRGSVARDLEPAQRAGGAALRRQQRRVIVGAAEVSTLRRLAIPVARR